MSSSTESIAKSYLEKNCILQLFDNLTSRLLYDQPEKPIDYIISYFENLESSRENDLEFDTFITKDDVEVYFNQVANKSAESLTKQQYEKAMELMNLKNYNKNPIGCEDNIILKETFIAESVDAIQLKEKLKNDN
ncbi:hypothetical protein SNEBB_000791 [Seison nebaliae]|nr:hypothetical protein SNEBB_000791 [Seison nebaliae]